MQCHSVSYPIEAMAPSTEPIPLSSKAATFSSSSLGRPTMRTVRRICQKSPERSPDKPAPFPASERSWQGKPAVTKSTGPIDPNSAVVTSSYCFTSGQCLANTSRGNSSFSQKATVSKPPVRSSPRLKPPIPENRSRTLSFCLILVYAPTSLPATRAASRRTSGSTASLRSFS